jgi:threonine dehydratase
MMQSSHRLSVERIEQAAKVIDPVFLNSPQFLCEPLNEELSKRLALKIETLNPIRSFKGRGADFLVSQIKSDERLVCAYIPGFVERVKEIG